jgi:hypothetical protein
MDLKAKMSRKELREKTRAMQPPIPISQWDLKELLTIYDTDSPLVLAKRSGLPYRLVYNLVRGRVKTVRNRHYLSLFGKSPPQQVPLKVDGTLFRAMAKLWLFFDDGATRVDLYRELLGLGPRAAIDHRIFSGKVKTVSARLEHAMRQKFIDAGVDIPLLEQWLDEFDELDQDDWVPYQQIRPMLAYIEGKLGVHPTSVLRQSVVKYETGKLKCVSRATYERILALQRSTQKVLRQSGPQQTERIREKVLGGKSGYTLFSEIEEELLFLSRHKRNGAKYYLGRSLWTYRTGKAKRVADWRARKIIQDCERYIRANPSLRLVNLPQSFRRIQIQGLMDVMVARSSQLLSRKDGLALEKRILRPSRARADYRNSHLGFVPFDRASNVLGMKPKAFDLMVASHCDIFRSVGTYSHRWYLPDLYLRELCGKRGFSLISAKYEKMASNLLRGEASNTCMYPSSDPVNTQ